MDGWAHFHGEVDGSFFTPWHFLFYSAFGFVALFLGYHQMRNVRQGYAFTRALPKGYWLSLVGVVVFGLGGFGDMIWHTLFGIEEGTEALMSPTHIMLATGMALVFSGPLRAAWNRTNSESKGWRMLGPALVGMTLLVTLLMFFTSYANPIVAPLAAIGAEFGEERAEQVEQVYVMNADGTGQMRLTYDGSNGASWPAWSPDGSQLAYTRQIFSSPAEEDEAAATDDPDTVPQSDIYIMNADGSNPVQVTNADGEEYGAAWSPDGQKLAYIGVQDGNADVYVVDVNGGEPQRLTTTEEDEWGPSWSPDGSQIGYSIADIWVMDADGANPRQLTDNGNSWLPRWSADGSQILFSGEFDDSTGVFLMNADGSNVRTLMNTDAFEGYASFVNNDRDVIFSSWETGVGQIYRMPVSGIEDLSEAVNLSNNPALHSRFTDVSADGQIVYAGIGNELESGIEMQDFGVSMILFTAAIQAGALALLTWRWSLPFGTFTLLFTLSTALLTLLNDLFFFIPGALLAGLIVDFLVQRWQPGQGRIRHYLVLAFLAPILYYGFYFLTIQLLVGINWSIHVWTGAIFISGVIGLVVALLMSVATREAQPAAG
ncbi:MAG: hypothetical protein SF029_22305 [bacterium]|nr:hypothetical protein [bacterium]